MLAVGGLGLETTVVCAILELFLTVIRNWNLDPEVIPETGLPRVSVIWNVVMARDFRVHEPRLFALVFLLFFGGLLKNPCATINDSIASAVDVPIAIDMLKTTDWPDVIALALVRTLKVTDVVE